MEFNTAFTTALIRWSHILTGIVWIGFFLCLHFIVRPYVASLKGEGQAEAYRRLIARGLKWCRGAGLTTLVLGIGVLGHLWSAGAYSSEEVPLTGRGRFIMWGMTLAVLMLANLFFFVTKAQNAVLNAHAAGIGPSDEQLEKARKMGLVNVYLSGPMLYIMVFAQNFSAFHYGHLGLGIVIGGAVMHLLVVLAERGSKN